MIDFTNFAVISFDCTGYGIYRLMHSQIDPWAIEYTTPLVGTFFDRIDAYIDFCEHYDRHTSVSTFADSMSIAHDGTRDDHQYLFKMSNEEQGTIHVSAGDRPDVTKWLGRSQAGREKTKIFVLDSTAFELAQDGSRYMTGQDRSELINRFHNLDGYTIFLTQIREEEKNDGKHFTIVHWQEAGPFLADIEWPETIKFRIQVGPNGSNVCRATVPFYTQVIQQHILGGPHDVPTNQAVIV